MAGGGRLARLVPAPFLHCGPGDPTVLVEAPHWEESGLPRVVLVHDLIPLRAPSSTCPRRARRPLPGPGRLGGRRRSVVTNSDHTRAEAIELLGCEPDSVVTVGAGVSPYFTPADGTDDELFRFYFPALEDRPFVLTVSGSDPRKGTERLVHAMAEVVRAGLDRGPARGGVAHRRVAGRACDRRPDRPSSVTGWCSAARWATSCCGPVTAAPSVTRDALAGRGLRAPGPRVGRVRHPGPGVGHHGPGRGGRHPAGHLRPRATPSRWRAASIGAITDDRAAPDGARGPAGAGGPLDVGGRGRRYGARSRRPGGDRPPGAGRGGACRPGWRWWARSPLSPAGSRSTTAACCGGRRRPEVACASTP